MTKNDRYDRAAQLGRDYAANNPGRPITLGLFAELLRTAPKAERVGVYQLFEGAMYGEGEE